MRPAGLGSSVVGVVDLCWWLVHNRRSKTNRPIANTHQTRLSIHIIRMVSAVSCHRALVSMAPSVACAISVSNALPEAWLNNHAYQKVTAMWPGSRSGSTRTGASGSAGYARW